MKRASLATLLAVQLIDAIGLGLVATIIPFYVGELSASPGSITQLVALFALSGVISAPLFGWSSDRVGRPQVIAIGVALGALSFWGLCRSQTLLWVFLLRALGGVGTGKSGVITALLLDLAPVDERARYVGWAGAAASAGLLVGPLLGGGLGELAPSLGLRPYQPPFLLAFALSLVALGLTVFGLPAGVDRSVPRAARPSSAVTGSTDLLIVQFGIFLGFGVMFATCVIYVQRVYGWGPFEAGCITSLATASVVVVRVWVAPPLVQSLGATAVLAASVMTFALFLFAVPCLHAWLLFGAAFCLSAASYSIACACITVLLAERGRAEDRGLLMGWAGSVGSVGMAVSAVASGYLFELLGPEAPFVMGAGLVLLFLGAYRALTPRFGGAVLRARSI